MPRHTQTADRHAERVLTRPCRHCGQIFEAVRPHQHYCKPSCRRAAFTGRQVQPRLPIGDADDLFQVPFE
jgi:hypothetical protein